MMEYKITRFMFGFQSHLNYQLRYVANRLFDRIGLPITADSYLVGIKVDERCDGFAVCIEPEHGFWKHEWLDSFHRDWMQLVEDEPIDYFHTDPRLNERVVRQHKMAKAAELIREKIGNEVSDQELFLGWPTEHQGYAVFPALVVARESVDKIYRPEPPKYEIGAREYCPPRSLFDAVIRALFRCVQMELLKPEPGADLEFSHSDGEIVNRAAKDLMYRVVWGTEARAAYDLFEVMQEVHKLRYERSSTRGFLLFSGPDARCTSLVDFEQPVHFYNKNARLIRKLLELSNERSWLQATSENGHHLFLRRLTEAKSLNGEEFLVEFGSEGSWNLQNKDEVLMYVVRDRPMATKSAFERERFEDLHRRFFPENEDAASRLADIIDSVSRSGEGALIIVSSAAAEEAARLGAQGVTVKPREGTPELVARLIRIDGAVFIDPSGVVHSFGAVVDGDALSEGEPARGSRFNAAHRYTKNRFGECIGVVISVDGMVDVLPRIRKRLERRQVLDKIENFKKAFERAPIQLFEIVTLHRELQEVSFYLSDAQCSELNELLSVYEGRNSEASYFSPNLSEFKIDDEFSEDYLF